jgi:hypothetical protein
MSVEHEAGGAAPPVPGLPASGPGSPSWRLASLEALLDRACVAHTGVRAAGLEGEIAVIDAPVTEVAALATLAPEIRRLGFRYTTIDLAHTPGSPASVADDPAPPDPVTVRPRRASNDEPGPGEESLRSDPEP